MRDSFKFLLLFILGSSFSYGQESRHQISVEHDNDFLFAIDRYYTAGTFISYDRLIESDFLLKKTEVAPIQLSFTLGQETYTPRELFETDFDRLERPYAGYLFGKFQISQGNKNSIFRVSTELGLAGEQSLAGKFQVAYHELINEFIPTWAGEIGNSAHINLGANYVRDYDVLNSNLFKHFALESTLALGTRDIYAQQEATAFFGNRSRAHNSSAFGRLSDGQEFYGYGGLGVRYVLLNALIAGHPFGDDSPFVLDETPLLFQFKAGLIYRGARNTYEFGYRFQTNQTEREGRSQYTVFKFSRRF
ncbi:lipid A deacylase LpxR family protein [Dokdonia sinensis]|nr:lipid A-modifier LpxR family protein [Dokdonia sinensis]